MSAFFFVVVLCFSLQNVEKESLSLPTQQISTPQAADDTKLSLQSITGTQTWQLWHAATWPSLDYYVGKLEARYCHAEDEVFAYTPATEKKKSNKSNTPTNSACKLAK